MKGAGSASATKVRWLRGRLLALREGDLAYLHVHPTGGRGSRIEFHASFPSLDRYRLFLQFAHQGSVRTAAFTVENYPLGTKWSLDR
jgi:hypothetical protein